MKVRPHFLKYVVIISAVLLGLLSFLFGLRFATELTATRNPASEPGQKYDFSNLDGDALLIAARDRLIRGARINTAGNLMGLQLGHFHLKNTQQIIVDVCQIYPSLQLTFMAGDMAVSGEPTEMILSGACTLTLGADGIAPLLIEAQSIMELQPRDRDLQQGPNNSVNIQFKNISDAWPKIWVLKQVRIAQSPTSSGSETRNIEGQLPSEIVVDLREIRQIFGKNIVLDWH